VIRSSSGTAIVYTAGERRRCFQIPDSLRHACCNFQFPNLLPNRNSIGALTGSSISGLTGALISAYLQVLAIVEYAESASSGSEPSHAHHPNADLQTEPTYTPHLYYIRLRCQYLSSTTQRKPTFIAFTPLTFLRF